MLSLSHFLLILLGVLLIFGSKKFPQIIENISKGMKAIKRGMNECEKDTCEISTQYNTSTKRKALNKLSAVDKQDISYIQQNNAELQKKTVNKSSTKIAPKSQTKNKTNSVVKTPSKVSNTPKNNKNT